MLGGVGAFTVSGVVAIHEDAEVIGVGSIVADGALDFFTITPTPAERTLAIPGESRVLVVLEGRTFEVTSESRIWLIQREERILLVPPDLRRLNSTLP